MGICAGSEILGFLRVREAVEGETCVKVSSANQLAMKLSSYQNDEKWTRDGNNSGMDVDDKSEEGLTSEPSDNGMDDEELTSEPSGGRSTRTSMTSALGEIEDGIVNDAIPDNMAAPNVDLSDEHLCEGLRDLTAIPIKKLAKALGLKNVGFTGNFEKITEAWRKESITKTDILHQIATLKLDVMKRRRRLVRLCVSEDRHSAM